MNAAAHTEPGVFIIESLELEDEVGPQEGKLLSDILVMSGVSNKYLYIRTKEELVWALSEFTKSNYRFLHLSFHGDAEAIHTTLNRIPHGKLGGILKQKLRYKRLFMSACSGVNESLANNVFALSECNSIIGPNKMVYMNEIAIFWASFYHLMFKKSPNMKKVDIVATLNKLIKLYDIPFKYYKRSTKTPFYKEENFQNYGANPNFTDYENV